MTLSPTIVTTPTASRSGAVHSRRRQSGSGADSDVLERRSSSDMNAQNAVEAPRFQTRHLVSSFDNHAWNRGDLMLDERIPSAVAHGSDSARAIMSSITSRYANGAAPVADQSSAERRHRSRRGPVLQPLRSRLVNASALRSAACRSIKQGSGRGGCARWRSKASGSAPVPGSTKAGSIRFTRASGIYRGANFRRRRLKRSASRNLPKHFPSFAAISRSINSRRRNSGRSCLHLLRRNCNSRSRFRRK